MTTRDALSTKIKILDAAEVVYAKDGVEGLTLRIITERAGVNLASINYHFGHKESLTHAMLARVLTPLYDETLGLLRTIESTFGDRMAPTHVAAALILPLIRELTAYQPPPHRLALLSRISTDPTPLVREYTSATYQTISTQCDKAFVRSARRLSPSEAQWRAHVFFNALPGSIVNQNTATMLSDLITEPGISVRSILQRFGSVLECLTPGPSESASLNESIDETLLALSESRTCRAIAEAFLLTSPNEIALDAIDELGTAQFMMKHALVSS